MIQPRRSSRAGWTGLLLLWLAASGCVTSRMAATRIAQAPNRHDSLGMNRTMKWFWAALQTNFVELGSNGPLVYLTIPVGPPAAEIKAIEVPPHDYHVKWITWTNLAPHGRTHFFATMVLETNAAPLFTAPDPPATIFLLHGYMLSKESMAPWAFMLAEAGYRVILVDLRGHGQSTGDFVYYGKHETADLSQVLDCLQARGLCDNAVGVLGYSYGATLALHWAARDTRLRAVVALAPYNHLDDAFTRLVRDFKIPITRRAAQKALALAAARLDLRWADWSGEAAIRQVRVPVLLIGGGKDAICTPDDIAALHNAASGPSSVITIPMANHDILPALPNLLADPVKAWFHVKMRNPPS
jgi:pimeloyl-ACP methyl ester carboxylesterase